MGLVWLVYLFVYASFVGPVLAWPQAIWRPLWRSTWRRSRRLTLIFFPWVFVAFIGLVDRAEQGAIDRAVGHALHGFLIEYRFLGIYGLLFSLSFLFGGPIHVLPFWPKSWLRPFSSGRWTAPRLEVDTHGSAAWGTIEDARAAMLPRGEHAGFMLGRVNGVSRRLDPRYRAFGHVLTCAPTGAGKGVGAVIPALLDYPGSIFCLDVKGENYAVTQRARREFGNVVHLIDPFNATEGESSGFNPLSILDASSPEVVGDANVLADMLIVRDSGTRDSHWDESAAHLLQGLLIYVSTLPEPDRHLGTLRRLLTWPEGKLRSALETIGSDDGLAFGVVARSANVFLAKADRERSGVLSTAQRHTAFLDDPRIVEALNGDLDFGSLKTSNATVYLVIPPDKLNAYQRFARLAVGIALKAMVRTRAPARTPVFFLLDEFAQLGHFTPAEEAISLLRGYGVSLWLLVQDLSQLEATYPKWRTFLANTTLQAFATQDQTTTRYLTEALGQSTIVFETGSQSSSSTDLASSTHGSSMSTHLHGRPLLTSDEVRRLPSSKVIVLEQGKPPFLIDRLNYLVDPEFVGLFEPNPMHESESRSGGLVQSSK